MEKSKEHDTWQKIINLLLENADLEFRKTKQAQELREEFEKAVNNYEASVSEKDKEILDAYLGKLNAFFAAQLDFVYMQGCKDCVCLLKKLGVL